MKNTSKWWVRLCYIALFPIVLLHSCKKDDNGFQQELQNSNQKQSTSKRVSSTDIPEIMDFVLQKSNGNLQFTLEGKPGTREPDLEGVEVNTEDILQLTNGMNLSNFSFKMDASISNRKDQVSLVIKETSVDIYGYIVRYKMTDEWLNEQGDGYNFSTFTGEILMYDLNGHFIAKQEFDNGNKTNWETRDPCNGGSGPGPGGADPNGTDPNGGGQGGQGGCSGNCGTGPGGPTIEIVCIDCFHPEHLPHNSPCLHPSCTAIFQVNHKSVVDETLTRDYLRNPCIDCGTVNDCEFGWDEDCECIEENEEVGININIPVTPCDKLNHRSEDADFMAKINEMNEASNIAPPAPRSEKGFILNGLGVNTEYEPVEGDPNIPKIEFPIPTGTTIDGFMHNHFFINDMIGGQQYESLSIFSEYDLYYLYVFARNGHISNPSNFTYVQVYQGNMYSFQITNIDNLIMVGNNLINDPVNGISNLVKTEMSIANIKHGNTSEENRDNLARMLDKFDSLGLNLGIDLYYSPVENPNWKKVQVNSDNSISLEDCN